MTPHGVALNLVITISFVLGENNPSPLRHERQPVLIRRATGKEIAVTPVLNAPCYQGFDDGLAVVQILIQMKDEIVKPQLLGFPSGLPLRFAFLRGHIPWLVRVLTREH